MFFVCFSLVIIYLKFTLSRVRYKVFGVFTLSRVRFYKVFGM